MRSAESVAVHEVLTEALDGRYSVEREIAHGGWPWSIWLARPDRGRPAAKVMLPALVTAIGADRFLREIGIVLAM